MEQGHPPIYLTPQESWLQGANSVETSDGEVGKNLFIVSSAKSIGPRGQEAPFHLADQKTIREGGQVFVPLIPDLQFAFQYWSNFTLREGEVPAIKLQEIDAEGMTVDDPEFAIVKLDEKTEKYIPVEDETRGITVTTITEAFYNHWEKGNHTLPTYRDERRSLADKEGNAGPGPENRA